MKEYLLVCLVVFFAGVTQGLSGFGSVLLSLPLLAIFLEIKMVIPLVALFGLAITIVLLRFFRYGVSPCVNYLFFPLLLLWAPPASHGVPLHRSSMGLATKMEE
jgi:uncharacterized membrane protein YfcA